MRILSKGLATISLLVLISTLNTNAAPLKNVPQKITQPDGTTLQCFASGDEFYNWLHCADGYTIILNPETGFFVYADKVGDELVPTNLIFGIDEPKNLQKRLTISHEKYMELRRPFDEMMQKRFKEREERRKKDQKKTGDQFQSQRTINNIVIFIEFADAHFENIDSLVAAKNAEFNTNTLSMQAYFNEVSYGQLNVVSHFFPRDNNGNVVPFRHNQNRTGANQITAALFALIDISTQIPTNIDLDTDNDGYVDAITFILQGNVFPIQFGLMAWNFQLLSQLPFFPTINGKNPSWSAFLIEKDGGSGLQVAAHEFAHILGGPDLYFHLINSVVCWVGLWDPMGCYYDLSIGIETIPHFVMRLKEKYFGWVNIPTITTSGTYTLNPVTSSTNNVYRINSPYSDEEFFLLEYRRYVSGGFNVPGYSQNNGLLITRITPSKERYSDLQWNLNQGVYVYRPGGTTTSQGDLSQALFSDEYGRTAINSTTDPSPFLFDGSPGGLDISHIRRVNGGEQISFRVNIPGSAYPNKFSVQISSVNPSDAGVISSVPSVLTDLDSGAAVRLIATVTDNCYRFANWSDTNGTAISTRDTLDMKIISDTFLIANFEKLQYRVTADVNTVAGGTATVVGANNHSPLPNDTAFCGDSVTIEAFAAEDYIFTNWVNSADAFISAENPLKIAVISDTVLIANFEKVAEDTLAIFAVTLGVNPAGTGTVAGGGSYDSNTVATISATANNCYSFSEWRSGNTVISTQNPLTVVVSSDTTLTAIFELLKFNLTVTSAGNGSVSGSENAIDCGASRVISATANSGYKFQHWSSGGNVISTSNPLTVQVLRDTNLVANFVEEDIEIEFFDVEIGGINPVGAGTVSGYGKYEKNTSVTLTAHPNPDYEFVNWSANGTVISDENPFTFILTQDTVIVANFDYVGISENILISSISILPNPTSSDFVVSFDVLKAGNMQIVLTDLSGRILLEIFDGFVSEGNFSKTVSTVNLARGVYFLQIFIDGNSGVEKVVLE